MESARLRDCVPSNILQGVAEDNDQFMNDRQVFNVDYFAFVLNVYRAANPPPAAFNHPPSTPNPGLGNTDLSPVSGY